MIRTVNGSPHLAGAAALEEPLAPVVGLRRCRITRPLVGFAPDLRGRFGRAWRVDLVAARMKVPLALRWDAAVVHWVVEAPWSSEVVHSYSLMCVHLRSTSLNVQPVTRYLEGATHEIALIAIHPGADRAPMLAAPTDPRVWLNPPVFGAQIVAASDEAAAARVGRAVELVCEGRLSPHPTHVRSWVQLFGDSMMLRVAAAAAPGGAREG